jgi:VWFA-related protein
MITPRFFSLSARSIVCSLAAALSLTAPAGSLLTSARQKTAERQDNPVKLKSQLVEVRAVVTTKQGQPVADLKKEDFEVLENGRAQDISFFSAERIGTGPAAAGNQPLAKPASSAERDSTSITDRAPLKTSILPAGPPQRTVVIIVDTLTMEPGSLLRAKPALRRFVDEKLTDRDMTAIVATSGTLGIRGLFTRDRQILRYCIDRLSPTETIPDTLFSPYLASMVLAGDKDAFDVALAILHKEDDDIGYLLEFAPRKEGIEMKVKDKCRRVVDEANYRRRVTLAMIQTVAERLAGTPGQRMIAVLSDGISAREPGTGRAFGDLEGVTSRAARSGVVIYTLDPKGLVDPAPIAAQVPGATQREATLAMIKRFISNADIDQRDGLRVMAEETGGEAFLNTNDLSGSLQKTLDANSAYYALAYYPEDTTDKRFRRITIKIKDHPDYQVRAQKGYQPPETRKETASDKVKSAEQRLLKAMTDPLPADGIAVESWADYYEREGEQAQIFLHTHISGDGLSYKEGTQGASFNLQVATIIFDLSGNVVNKFAHTEEGTLKAERANTARSQGFIEARPLSLKPGVYQVRVGVREEGSDRIGTSILWIKVPDVGHSKLGISSILVGKDLSESKSSAVAYPLVIATPSVRKQLVPAFKTGDVLSFCFRVYNSPLDNDGKSSLAMQYEFLKDGQPITSSLWQPVAGRQIAKDAKGVEVGGGFKLSGIAAGIYDFRVNVKDLHSNKTVQSSVPFAVEE